MAVIKKIPLRDWGFIKHINNGRVTKIKVVLSNYDKRFNEPSAETLLAQERKRQLNQIFKAFNG